jgi:hypothetical protein
VGLRPRPTRWIDAEKREALKALQAAFGIPPLASTAQKKTKGKRQQRRK